MTHVRESKVAAIMMAAVFAYAASILATGKIPLLAFANLLSFYLVLAAVMMLAGFLGLVLSILLPKMASKGLGQETPLLHDIKLWFAKRWVQDKLVSFIWPPIFLAVLLTIFNCFKQLVLGFEQFQYDELLAQWDRYLFFGNDPWTITHAIFPYATMTYVLDMAYHLWFLPMTIGVIICSFLPSSTFRLRTQYLLTYFAVWVGIGTVLAYYLPSAGPCFYNDFVGQSDTYAKLVTRLNFQASEYGANRLEALVTQDYLRSALGKTTLMPGGGISAMPSVHNALSVLFAIAACQVNRKLGLFMIGYAVVIWLASIHLGWHYAWDGIVSAIITIAFWYGAGKLAELIERTPEKMPKTALA
jgi:hypothetical protein